MDTIGQKLRDFIAESILFSDDGYPHSDEASFLENGVIDSMSAMELVLFAEKTFEVTINDEEIVPENLDSIRQLSDFIRKKQEEDQ